MGAYIGIIYLVIFMAIFSFTINNYEYGPNVVVYVIGRGLLYSLIFFSSWQALIVHVIFRIIIGLIFVKIMLLLVDYFPGAIYTFLAGMFIEYFLTKLIINVVI